MGSEPLAFGYVDFIKKHHSTYTSLGANWLGSVPYGDDSIIWRIKNSQEQVTRLIYASGAWGGKVYGLWSKRSKWKVHCYDRTKAIGPYDAWSLWDVLHAEKASRQLMRVDLTSGN